MFSKVTIIGNLGRDPELRYLDSGLAICSFSVATMYTNKQKEKEITWWRVTTFDKLAETCNQYLAKGRQVYVEGRLKVDLETGGPAVYQKKDGTMGASFELVAHEVRFLGSKPAVEEAKESAPADNEDEMPF
jgi:single-strand DNA-binding protein